MVVVVVGGENEEEEEMQRIGTVAVGARVRNDNHGQGGGEEGAAGRGGRGVRNDG